MRKVLSFNWFRKRPHNELDLKIRENILQLQRQLDNNFAIMTSAKKHVPIVKKRSKRFHRHQSGTKNCLSSLRWMYANVSIRHLQMCRRQLEKAQGY